MLYAFTSPGQFPLLETNITSARLNGKDEPHRNHVRKGEADRTFGEAG
jgi:hypothetical protein